MIVQGVDLSLTGTGLARIHWAGEYLTRPRIDAVTVGSKPAGSSVEARAGRLNRLVTGCVSFLIPSGLLVIESPAYSRQAGARHERSGLWWAIVREALRMDCRVVEVSPTARARYATGKGTAKKDAVIAAVEARYEVEVANDNEADAIVLAAIGARLVGFPIEGARTERWMDDVVASVRGDL